MYGHVNPPRHRPLGRRKMISEAAKKALLEYHGHSPFLYLDELVRYLEEEWDMVGTAEKVPHKAIIHVGPGGVLPRLINQNKDY